MDNDHAELVWSRVSLSPDLIDTIRDQLNRQDLAAATQELTPLSVADLVALFERFEQKPRAVLYRLLEKQRALDLFEELPPALQGELLEGLQDSEVTRMFADLDPDDRVWLLDEVPAVLATRLMRDLPAGDRELTASMLGYPQASVGRRMTPEYVSTRAEFSVAQTLARVRDRLDEAETVYTIPVIADGRRVIGVVSLRDLIGASEDTPIAHLMEEVVTATVAHPAESAARLCTERGFLALPIVDSEDRLVGMLTIDDAVKIIEESETEDAARQGGVEPLRRPYLATPVTALVRSRIVWLLVLAVGATLTVHVLEVFEDTLAQVTVLALFVPLLIGTGGNTGNQAATTVTRALALDDVRPRDILRVLSRELRAGALLGLLLGALGFAVAGLIYSPAIGFIIGATLLAICTTAAAVGGIMPLAARAIRVDPAVFSNPFITTFVDATGLILYFLIARSVLQL